MPLVLFAVAFVLVRRYLRSVSTPDVDRIDREYQAMRAANPRLSTDQLVQHIIRRQAIRSGMVGAITGLGGFVTILIGLPIDVLASARIQATMVQFIATAYGRGTASPTELQIRQALVLAGGSRLARSTQRVLLEFGVQFLGKSLAKVIPFVGALISFGVNYALAQASGRLAQKWYSGQLRLPEGDGP